MIFPCPSFISQLKSRLEQYFALRNHNHTDYASTDHNHDADYAAIDHNHDTDYAPLDHNHDERYYTETEVDALLAGVSGAMVGEIRMWPKSQPPSNWLICDGTQILRGTVLHGVIGDTFGDGDGETTVNLPNFEGRFPVGSRDYGGHDMWLGATGGEEYHTLTPGEMPAHQHYVREFYADGYPGSNFDYSKYEQGTGTHYGSDYTGYTGGGTPHENLPPYLAIHFIIYAGTDG